MSKELSGYDFYPDLKNITCKTLIIHGAYDGMPLELSKKIQGSIANSKLVVIKNAGHFPFIDRQKKYNDIVSHFIYQNKL